jgi:uncharacterized damage-inducible protein DinB
MTAADKLTDHAYRVEIPRLPEHATGLEVDRISGLLGTLAGTLIDLVSQISDSDLSEVRRGVRIYNGRTVDITVWQFLLQHITHQTHHQGQISILLDELGVEHEFGNVFPLVPETTETS